PVNQAQTEQQERRGNTTEQKILQRRLRRLDALLVERGHDVETKAEQLERQENQQQVFCAQQEHHARGRQQQQREVFADVLRESGLEREEAGGDRQSEHHDFHQRGQRIQHPHPV